MQKDEFSLTEFLTAVRKALKQEKGDRKHLENIPNIKVEKSM